MWPFSDTPTRIDTHTPQSKYAKMLSDLFLHAKWPPSRYPPALQRHTLSRIDTHWHPLTRMKKRHLQFLSPKVLQQMRKPASPYLWPGLPIGGTPTTHHRLGRWNCATWSPVTRSTVWIQWWSPPPRCEALAMAMFFGWNKPCVEDYGILWNT